MFQTQNQGSVNVIKQASTATTATATGTVDRLGFDDVKIQVFLDSASATSSNPATLTITESDDATTYSAITGLTGDATDGFTIPAADTSNPQILDFNIDCRARKRYLKVTITPGGATQIVGATAVLGKPDDLTLAQSKPALTVNV